MKKVYGTSDSEDEHEVIDKLEIMYVMLSSFDQKGQYTRKISDPVRYQLIADPAFQKQLSGLGKFLYLLWHNTWLLV